MRHGISFPQWTSCARGVWHRIAQSIVFCAQHVIFPQIASLCDGLFHDRAREVHPARSSRTSTVAPRLGADGACSGFWRMGVGFEQPDGEWRQPFFIRKSRDSSQSRSFRLVGIARTDAFVPRFLLRNRNRAFAASSGTYWSCSECFQQVWEVVGPMEPRFGPISSRTCCEIGISFSVAFRPPAPRVHAPGRFLCISGILPSWQHSKKSNSSLQTCLPSRAFIFGKTRLARLFT